MIYDQESTFLERGNAHLSLSFETSQVDPGMFLKSSSVRGATPQCFSLKKHTHSWNLGTYPSRGSESPCVIFKFYSHLQHGIRGFRPAPTSRPRARYRFPRQKNTSQIHWKKYKGVYWHVSKVFLIQDHISYLILVSHGPWHLYNDPDRTCYLAVLKLFWSLKYILRKGIHKGTRTFTRVQG